MAQAAPTDRWPGRLVEHLAKRGHEVVWEVDPLFRVLQARSSRPLPWRQGSLVAPREKGLKVELSHASLLKEFVKKQLAKYDDRLGDDARGVLAASKRAYQVRSKRPRGALFDTTVEALAVLADGVILDNGRRRFFTRQEWSAAGRCS